ncbi:MAG: class I adenylate-forming enzyme family protein [Acidimicrobiales bacterium]
MTTTLPAMLVGTAARFGDRPAVISNAGRRSWSELVDDVRRRAGGLAHRGIGPGDAVAIVLPNDHDFVTTFLGTLWLGAVAVPLNPLFTVAELGLHLQHGHVSGIVTTDGLAPPIREWTTHARAGQGVWVAEPTALDAAAPEASGTDGLPADASRPEAPALYAFSSGSTGTPKGMLRTQANLANEADHFFDTVGVGEHDVILTVVALFHAHGLGNCLQASVRSGAAMVLVEQFQREAVLEAIERERVTVFPSVPFICQTLAETRRADRYDTSSLRLCLTAGAPLARETFELFLERFGLPIRQLYGCSEAGSVTVNLDEGASATAASVGRPMKGIELGVIGDSGESRGPGETGEICFSSPALTSGYVGVEPEANGVFNDGWFRTGDVGHLDESGNLYVTGRTKLFISTSGYKVDPFEVENVLRQHAGVADVVVVGSRGALGEEVVKAVVVRTDGDGDSRPLRRELLSICRSQLAVYKVPRVVEFRAEIPKSPLGKILRKYLV